MPFSKIVMFLNGKTKIFNDILLRFRDFAGTSSSNDVFNSLGLRFLRGLGTFTLGGIVGIDGFECV